MYEMLKKSIESNSLTELNIIGCAAPMINVASGRTPVIQGLSMLLRSTSFQKYEHLKVLTIGQDEDCLADSQFKGKKQNQVLEGLSQFSLKTKSKLTHIHIYSYGQWDLKTQVLPILIRMSDSLLHFSFIDDNAINDVMRRVISIKALAKVLNSGDLFSLDEQMSQEEEKMKEFVYSTHTINKSYGHRNRFNPIPSASVTEHFREEFIYLYKVQVAELFRELPNLKTFTLYGFPFRRSDVD